MANASETREIGFSRQTLAGLWRALANLATSDVGPTAMALAGALLALLLTINGLNVLNSYVGRDFMTAIAERNRPVFVWEAARYTGVFALLTIAAVLYRFTEERLGLLWRDSITRRVVDRYLLDRLYYRLSASGALSNPDQRIADDVRTFTTMTLSLTLVFLNGVLTILAFSGVLWSISRTLFVVAVAYATVGSLLAVYLGRPLVHLNYDQADKEADFRADLIHVRENVESVALLNREAHLRRRLLGHVDALIGNLKRIVAVNRNLGFFTTGYNYVIQLIPVLIVAPLFIGGTVEFGVISQASMAFAHVLGAFSLVVTQFPTLSSYAAVLARLAPLAGLTQESAVAPAQPGIGIVEDPERLAFERLTVCSPQDGRALVRELSEEVRAGTRLLITARHDRATNALQRAVAGIWEAGEGRILRPPLEDVHLLPERPYLPPGRLRDLLRRREGESPAEDGIWRALHTVGVDQAVRRVGGLDVERDWDDQLSVDEQRRVNLARLLIAAPRFAVISNLGSGLGADGATCVLDALAACDIGCIALGDGILRHDDFDVHIDIDADGHWTRTVKGAAK